MRGIALKADLPLERLGLLAGVGREDGVPQSHHRGNVQRGTGLVLDQHDPLPALAAGGDSLGEHGLARDRVQRPISVLIW